MPSVFHSAFREGSPKARSKSNVVNAIQPTKAYHLSFGIPLKHVLTIFYDGCDSNDSTQDTRTPLSPICHS